MEKSFLFVQTTVGLRDGSVTPSWELINVGNSNLMHAAWNPERGALACQFNSVKENFVDYPVINKNGKMTPQERRAEQYYRIVVEDKQVVEFILKNLTLNYTDQPWDIIYTPPVPEESEKEETISA